MEEEEKEKHPIISAKDKQFDNLFSKHVKQKKRYEINVIAQVYTPSSLLSYNNNNNKLFLYESHTIVR